MKITITNFFLIYSALFSVAAADDFSCASKVLFYVKSLTTLRSQFVQNNSDGSVSSGILHVKSPRYFKLNYSTPRLVVINGSNSFVTYYDKQLDQALSMPGINLFRAIFASDEYNSIDNHIVCAKNRGYLTIYNDAFGIIVLRFKLSPVEIEGIDFSSNNDSMGVKVRFLNVQYNIPISTVIFNQFD